MKIRLRDVGSFKELIIRKGFSQRRLGEELGVTSAYACQIVNGVRNPGPALARKLMERLGVSFDDIFFVDVGCKCAQSSAAAGGGEVR